MKELKVAGGSFEFDEEEFAKEFSNFIKKLLSLSERDDTINRIPQSELWLVNCNEYIGTVIIRHELDDYLLKVDGHIGFGIRPSMRKKGFGKLILKLALHECSNMGIKRILITCHPDNIASRKIIEHNGGTFENEISSESGGNMIKRLRYWITL